MGRGLYCLNRQTSGPFVTNVLERVAVDRRVADRGRLKARAYVLEDVGVDGKRYIKRMRGRFASAACDLRADHDAADRGVNALVP